MHNIDFSKKIGLLIIITTLVRCIAACMTGLGNDEVYYYTYALQPDLNHFDHPPMVGLVIRFFTINLFWVNTFSMRLGAIVFAAIGTWLIAATGKLIENERTGYIAALLYNISIYTSIISGLFILPDSSAVVFWLAAIYCMLRIIKSKNISKEKSMLLFFGVWVGLAIMSKIHGIFLWVGFGAYILIHQRALLKNINLYLAFIITCIIISPIVIWNYQHDFITLKFHGERVTFDKGGINFNTFISATAGQLFYNNPILFVFYNAALIAALRGRRIMEKPYRQLLLWCSLPIILATILVSLFRQVLPHWSGPGFIGLMLLSAAWLDTKLSYSRSRKNRLILNAAMIFTIVVLAGGLFFTQFFPGTTGAKTEQNLGRNDITLDMYRWSELTPQLEALQKRDISLEKMTPSAPLIVNKWFPGGHLLFYVARSLKMQVIGEGNLDDLHKFIWLNEKTTPILPGQDAYYIAPSNYNTDPKLLYGRFFETIEPAAAFPQMRGGQIVRYWYVYRLKTAKKTISSSSLKQ